jgi:hypothetical protein
VPIPPGGGWVLTQQQSHDSETVGQRNTHDGSSGWPRGLLEITFFTGKLQYVIFYNIILGLGKMTNYLAWFPAIQVTWRPVSSWSWISSLQGSLSTEGTAANCPLKGILLHLPTGNHLRLSLIKLHLHYCDWAPTLKTLVFRGNVRSKITRHLKQILPSSRLFWLTGSNSLTAPVTSFNNLPFIGYSAKLLQENSK